CGAAGLYNILEPEASAELGRKKAAAIAATGAGVVAVANPGCAMQIARHLREIGHGEIRVVHPVELLDAVRAGGRRWRPRPEPGSPPAATRGPSARGWSC